MKFKSIVFWLEYPLFHISPLIKSISEQSGLKTIVVCEKKIPQWRLDMGFVPPDFGVSDVYVEPTSKVRKRIEKTFSDKESVHIFHGLRGVKKNHKSFITLTKELCSLGLYFEPSVFGGTPKGILRKQIYRVLFFKIKNHVDIMFALGNLGKDQYTKLGLANHKVFSFPYFIDDDAIIDKTSIEEISRDKNKSLSIYPKIKLLYVGQLIPTKNIPLLIKSFKQLVKSNKNITLSIVGSGFLEDTLKQQVIKSGLEDRVYFLGKKSQAELKHMYQSHDIFILPSRFDGWGAVSVEALANGLPIVISDRCGSASIVKNQTHGVVFKSNSVKSLTKSLQLLINNIESYQSEQAYLERIAYVRHSLSASAGKKLFIKALANIKK